MGFLSEYKLANKLLQQKKQVVFYAESRHYYQYFEKLINDLLANDITICYITSDDKDPLLNRSQGKFEVVYIKWMLGFLFSKIRTDVMIMTMPDLGNFLFKKSSGAATYIYMFHAAVSTHQQYRKQAFYNYDVIFCTGEYQEKEIRLAEVKYQQKSKEVVRYGYPLLAEIENRPRLVNNKPVILIAPSWFDGCIFEMCLEELLQQLSKLPYSIILRSHPEYEKRKKKSFRGIQKLVKKYENVSIDITPNILERLPSTDILITDRSGIALEFAFGTGKSVLFIETALKQTNPDWKDLGIEPIENRLRSEIGITILPTELNQIQKKINELKNMNDGFAEKMLQLKKDLFYNSEESYKKGLAFVLTKLIKD